MSGRSIGTALGFVVGFYFGNPSLGATLGGMIGGAVDPDKVQGAKVGELPVQRSLTGGVQPVVLGTSLVDQCLIMWAGKARVVKEKDQQGKGGGPVVVNEVLYQDYRIRVCRSSAADGSQVEGFPMIFEDGRLVYDTRPNPRISAADSAKWAQNVVFYYGGAAQQPDPTEEAALGVGNASAHRQIASFVKVNQKMTDFGNRVPTYEVVVSRCATTGGGGGGGDLPYGSLLVTGIAKTTGGPVFAEAIGGPGAMSFVGIDPLTGADLPYGTPTHYDGTWAVASGSGVRYSTDDRQTWLTGTISIAGSNPGQLMGGENGWLTVKPVKSPPSAFVSTTSLPTTFNNVSVNATFTDGSNADYLAQKAPYLIEADNGYFLTGERSLFRSDSPEGPYVAIWDSPKESAAGRNPNGASIIGWYDLVYFEDEWYAVIEWDFRLGMQRYQVIKTASLYDWSTFTVLVDVARAGDNIPAQLCIGGDHLVCYNNDGTLWTSANSWATPITTGLTGPGMPISGGVVINGGRRIVSLSSKFYCIGAADDCVIFNPSSLDVSAIIPLPIDSAIGIAASMPSSFAGVPIPDAPGYFIDQITGVTSGPAIGESSLCGTTLADVVRYICNRGQLDDAELYLTELASIPVRGVTLQSPGTCKDELEPLRQAHFFDPADFDSKLRFRMRGTVAVDLTINPDDLVFTEDDEEQNRILGQEVDLSRKHALNYLSLDLDYLRTPASHEFTTLDPSVVGTSDASVNEVFSHDEAMRISAIQHELLRMGNEGYRKFGLPMEYLPLVGASLVTLNGRRGRIDGYSLDLNAIWFDPVPYDRARAYDANVVAPVLTPPAGPGTSIKGPTDSVLLNVPVLRDADDKPGIIWAPRGYPNTAWDGAILQVLRDGVWLQTDVTTRACNTGTLLSDLPANDGPIDEVNTLQIRLSGGMDSITFAQFLNEGNPLAIQYPNGTAEILQAQFATEVTDGVYDCTRLIRGRQDTVNGSHLAGARVVFLNNDIRFVQVRKDDIGKTLSYRAVSNGTDPSLATIQTITLTTMESQREWQPYNVIVTKTNSCEYGVSFVGRHRLGTDANPMPSQWWIGWRVDFRVGDTIKSHMTQDQSFTYTQEMQVEDWGRVNCNGYVVTVSSVNEYTGTDGGGGSTGGTGTVAGDNFPAVVVGDLPDGYVGEPYGFQIGLTGPGTIYAANPFSAYGGYWEQYYVGEIVGNVTMITGGVGFGITQGVPLTAETRDSDAELWASGPLVVGGSSPIIQSITILPKPTYSMMDWSRNAFSKTYGLVDTSPPWTTVRLSTNTNYAFGEQQTRAGFSTGKRYIEFTISGHPGGGATMWVGVSAANDSSILNFGVAGHWAVGIGHDGVYGVEWDAVSGTGEVYEVGVGLKASGALDLTLAWDGMYHFAWNCDSPMPGLVIKSNCGNEPFIRTPNAGFSGLPNSSLIIPVGWDTYVAKLNNLGLAGYPSTNVAAPHSNNGTGHLIYAGSAWGKSTGKWRYRLNGNAFQFGACKVGHTDYLGVAGSGDSFGVSFEIGQSRTMVIQTEFGGTNHTVRVPVDDYEYVTGPMLGYDLDAHTVDILLVNRATQDYQLAVRLTGLPSGTWLPAAWGIGQIGYIIYGESAGPSGFLDWTITR